VCDHRNYALISSLCRARRQQQKRTGPRCGVALSLNPMDAGGLRDNVQEQLSLCSKLQTIDNPGHRALQWPIPALRPRSLARGTGACKSGTALAPSRPTFTLWSASASFRHLVQRHANHAMFIQNARRLHRVLRHSCLSAATQILSTAEQYFTSSTENARRPGLGQRSSA
jgi:hypothetical protein